MKPLLIHAFLAFGMFLFQLPGQELKKVVFISGKPSHGPMAHEHRAGNILLANRLNEAKVGVEAVVLPDVGYPQDPKILEDAATIVVFATGHKNHLLNPKLEEFDSIMRKGTGLVMIHWATEAQIGMPAKKFLEWMGGFCDLNWSVNPHWKPNFKSFPDHPISRGLEPFSVDDEWYYHMRFVGDLKGVTPILSDLPPPETLKRPDGARSGNPDVRRAVANGESQHVAWAYERPDGKGRGFGFTGAHNHVSWKNDMFRKVVLNAILWTAHVDIPADGVVTPSPSDEELKKNLDEKPVKKASRPPTAQKKTPYAEFDPRLVDREASRLFFEKQRELQMVKLDSTETFGLLVTALGSESTIETKIGLLRGITRGLEGRRSVAKPLGWEKVASTLRGSDNSEVRNMVRGLDQIFGDTNAADQALTQLQDSKLSLEQRHSLLRNLVTQQNPRLKDVLAKLLDEPAMRIASIRAFGSIDAPDAPHLLLSRYPEWAASEKQAVVESLAMRKNYATALLSGLKNKKLPREDIPVHVARSLSNLLGKPFLDVYGDLSELSEDKAELMARYTKLLSQENLEKADPSNGRLVFATSCAACHILYGEGGELGPDLTGSNRADLSYILLNMIDPSADVPEAYQLVTLHTKAGQILSGTIKQEDDQRVVLNMIGQTTTILKSELSKREVFPLSMMPEGLLPTLQDSQVLDLIKYLQTTEQVPMPK